MVTAGESGVDQAPVTGESIPVHKAAGDSVYAGTIAGAKRVSGKYGEALSFDGVDDVGQHPHRIRVECDRPHEVAKRIAAAEKLKKG